MPTTVTPYLSFRNQTREAFAFYAAALGATIETLMSYADMPTPPPDAAGGCADAAPAALGDGIMHACLRLPGGAMIFAGDVPPGMAFDGIRGVMIAVQFDAVDEAQRAFQALAAGGQVTMPLAPTFWAQTFGMLTDRFGVAWAINGAPIAQAG